MKSKLAIIIASSLLASSNALGAPQQGSSNGQPFKALQSQIDENRSLIENNSGAIDVLSQDVSEINIRIDNIDQDISQLETDIANNSSEIAAALERINSNESNLQLLGSELAALAARHDSDLQAVNDALAAIGTKLLELEQARQALAAQLGDQLAAITAQVNDNVVAIDSMLLNLITVNAQLTTINSKIMSLMNRQDQLEESQTGYEDILANLNDRVDDLEGIVDTLSSYHLYTFEGIRTDLPIASLNGWNQCYKTTYADRDANPENMVASCTSSKIMLACRATDNDTLLVAAYANRDEVFRDTGDGGNDVHTANGVDWYFSYNYSMGFAPVGEGVMRTSADTQDQASPHRLSWHTLDHNLHGWRCGSNTSLNDSSNFEKVIYQAD